MATNETKTTKADNRVEIFVPRVSGNTDPNLLIVINGKNYVLPKGKTSKVPDFVKYEYDRALRAKEAMDVRSAEMVDKAAEQEKNPAGA